jgi:hypothetical protein
MQTKANLLANVDRFTAKLQARSFATTAVEQIWE